MSQYVPQGDDFNQLWGEHQRALAIIEDLQTRNRKLERQADSSVPKALLSFPGEAARVAHDMGNHEYCNHADGAPNNSRAEANARFARIVASVKERLGGTYASRFAMLPPAAVVRVNQHVAEHGVESLAAAIDRESADG